MKTRCACAKRALITEVKFVEATLYSGGSFVQFSGVPKRVACELSKVGNALRLLWSGPRAGFGDIKLPARHAAASIMPAKLKPLIPELMNPVAKALAIMGRAEMKALLVLEQLTQPLRLGPVA